MIFRAVIVGSALVALYAAGRLGIHFALKWIEGP